LLGSRAIPAEVKFFRCTRIPLANNDSLREPSRR
jgi:hypothetical protein